MDYKGLIEWLYYVEDKFRKEREQRRDFDYVSLEEKTIQMAVEGLLPGFSNLMVTTSPLNLAVDINDRGVDKTCFVDEQLSDGYKIVLVLVLNLVSRILEANGALPDATPRSLLASDGIVLIDEIDLHLHPSWQQRIIGDLTRTFPNIQFIVTTHSPQVISSVKGESVFLVNDGEMQPLGTGRQTCGLDANQLLTDVFGTPFAAECKERAGARRICPSVGDGVVRNGQRRGNVQAAGKVFWRQGPRCGIAAIQAESDFESKHVRESSCVN